MEINFRPEDEAYLRSRLEAGDWPTADLMGMYMVHLLRQDEPVPTEDVEKIRELLAEVDDDEEGVDAFEFLNEMRAKLSGTDNQKRTA